MTQPLNIIVTAGGTIEPIDTVRKITNVSTGALGIHIVNELARKFPQANIQVIASKYALTHNTIHETRTSIKTTEVASTSDVDEAISIALMEQPIHIFVHAMAVSNYTVDKVLDADKFTTMIQAGNTNLTHVIEKSTLDTSGKLPSSMDLLTIMKHTPKLIHKIKELSPRTFLVGFKLLDGASESELFDAGFDLLRKNRCNLVVANDLKDSKAGNHKALLIYPEKSYDIATGKQEIARTLVNLIQKRAFVSHSKSIALGADHGIRDTDNIFIDMNFIGRKLYEKNYLPEVINHDRTEKLGTYDNLSMRNDDERFLITGRNVNKNRLKPTDLVQIERIKEIKDKINEPGVYAKVYYSGIIKPSMDAAIHDAIYKDQTHANAILHIHTNRVFLGHPYIDEQYPCGSKEGRDAILAALHDCDITRTKIIQMKKQGLIIVGETLIDCYNAVNQLFASTIYIDTDRICEDAEILSHIAETHAYFTKHKDSCLYTLCKQDTVLGCVCEKHTDVSVHFAIFTKADCAKKQNIVGNYLKLYDKHYILHTTAGCNLAQFYENVHHFKRTHNQEHNIVLMRANPRNQS